MLKILGEQCGDNCNQFFEALGISADDVAESSNVDDAESENAAAREVKLHKISDASGELEITEVSGMPLTQDMLNAEVRLKILHHMYSVIFICIQLGLGNKILKYLYRIVSF